MFSLACLVQILTVLAVELVYVLHVCCIHNIRFLKLFTDLPMEQIAAFEQLTGAELNAVKVVLADEVTRLLHGEDCLAAIHQTVKGVFAQQQQGSGSGNNGSSSGDLLESLPQVQLSPEDISASGGEAGAVVSVVELLIKGGFATSKNAARRLISLGGARVNDVSVTDEAAVVALNKDFDTHGRLKLSGSKKKHVVILAPDKQQ